MERRTVLCFVGVEDGQTMRVNLGASEVFVTFRVKKSEKFRRDKEDIHSEVNVSIVQATLGGAIKVPGILEDHVLQVSSFNPSFFDGRKENVLDTGWHTIPSTFSSDW